MYTATRMAVVLALMVGFAASSLFISCSSKSTKPVEEKNLLMNGSFEINGQPTLSGWIPGNPYLTTIVEEPAPGGGEYSLQLHAGGIPSNGFVRSVVPGLRDGDIVRLSAYVRGAGERGGGTIEVHTWDSTWSSLSPAIGTSTLDTSWTLLSLTDTISLGPNESVWIVLSSLGAESWISIGLFDCVTLVRLNE